MFDLFKKRKEQELIKPCAKITSHQIKSIEFKKNRFHIFNLEGKYVIKYKTKANKTYTIYSPKKLFIEAILFNCFYIPNYKISYLNYAFENISQSLEDGTKTLFFDHWTADGQIKYIRISNSPFVCDNVFYSANNNKKNWIPLIKGENEKLSFLQLIKYN